ncbi:LysR substrate-binding domain-containing protein [Paracoccus tegillarcae]|nr:LysR substrate-binding domain-containing protein [Paracoccus tegillarcae]
MDIRPSQSGTRSIQPPIVSQSLRSPEDLADHQPLRSYRADKWPGWFDGLGIGCPDLRGPVLDSSVALAELAAGGLGVALLPAAMFAAHLQTAQLVRPFSHEVLTGRYWLTRIRGRKATRAMTQPESWLSAR